jgi:hypothetical protein
MTKAQRNILIVMGGVFVCCLLPLLGVLAYWLIAPRIGPGRPLVVIHQPASGQRVQIGRAVAVHSTARDERKVARIELWADGQLQSSQTSSVAGGISPMTLMQGWQPTAPGSHTLVVRAFNSSGGSGQASVMVEVSTEAPPTPTPRPGETPTPVPTLPPGCAEPVGAYLAQEGDTPESIAAATRVTAEQIRICNPDLPPGPLPAGTVVLVPVREEATVTLTATVTATPTGVLTGTPTATPTATPTTTPTATPTEALPGGEEAPSPDGESPPDPIPEIPELGPATTDLDFEALVLEVDGVYMHVYCYGALGPATGSLDYVRIPPGDGYIAPAAGERRWDIAAYAAGAHRQTFSWPPDQPLRVAARCVGIIDPLHSAELGNFENTHGPTEWDGRRLVGTGHSADGRWFTIEYRINPAGAAEGIIPPPTNLHRQDFGPLHQLRWDWAGDESTIDGFRLYLNDSVQWAVTNPGARHTLLPDAWINPPCDETYRFHVTAYRGPLGGGVESISSDPVVLVGPACANVWHVTFSPMQFTCVTADAPGPCPGFWAGPVYGTFFANARSFHFDSGPPGGLWVASGPSYHLLDLFFNPWCHDCPADNSLVVPVGPAESLTIGAIIVDHDPPGDPPPDEFICLNGTPPMPFAALHDGLAGDVTCATPWGAGTVHYIINAGPGGGGGGGAGAGPSLPDLTITNMWSDVGGVLHIAVQNAGTVPVVGWDLAVRLERISTHENLGTYIFSGFTLNPGEMGHLTRPEWVLGVPTDLVATLDPDNALPETNKDNNAYSGGDGLVLMMGPPAPPAHAQTFNMVYHYHSNHGNMSVRVTPLHLDAPVPGLPAVSVGPFANGDGVAPVHIIYSGAERAYTEQLRLEMVDEGGHAFYSRPASVRLVWTP